MKKIVIIVVDERTNEEEMATFEGIKKTHGGDCHLLKVHSVKPQQILEDTLGVIRKYGPSHYNRMIVLYTGGIGFHLLENNLPCDKVDINLLMQKLKEVAGGHETPQKRYLVCTMYAGAFQSLIDH